MYLLQTSVRELHNDLILPVPQGELYGARNQEGRVFIGDTSMRKYMTNNIKHIIIRHFFICRCETYIIAVLFQFDLKNGGEDNLNC